MIFSLLQFLTGSSGGGRDHNILLRFLDCPDMDNFILVRNNQRDVNSVPSRKCVSVHCISRGWCFPDHLVSCLVFQGSGHKLCLGLSVMPEKESQARMCWSQVILPSGPAA